MGLWIGLGLLAVLLWWLLVPRRRSLPPPEADTRVPINQAELAEAEQELKQDPRPRSLDQAVDDDADDWGPGAR